MPALDAKSKARLDGAHPLLRKLFTRVAELSPIIIMDSQRGREAQERAFREGHSKVHFGDSAHNWSPSVALDVAPAPYDPKDRVRIASLAKLVFRIAKEMGIELRWGGDFNRDGDKTTSDAWDMYHFELHPWRKVAAADCVPFGEAPRAPPAQPEPEIGVLVQGDRGPAVTALQRRLSRLGFYKAKIDDDFGPRTHAAVEAFQKSNSLTVDGKVGPETRAALEKLIPNP